MNTAAKRTLRGVWLGRRPYAPVLALQERLHEERVAGRIGDTVLLLEHTPVITLGKSANAANVLLSEERLAELGIEVARTSRGGDVTLHAPGQLVGYPIVDLSPDRCDVRRYVRDLALVMQTLSLRHGVSGGEVSGKIGLWVDRTSVSAFPGEHQAGELAKLGAIGVRISRWVTLHGFALNLATQNDLFQLIVPCGIRGHGVTSIAELVGREPDVLEEAILAHRTLATALGAEPLPFLDWSTRSLPLGLLESDGPTGLKSLSIPG